jgi:CheY-like chemotaxis protein
MNPSSFFAPGSFAGVRVLYAEDEPTLREAVALLLEAQGCRVSTVKDGVEALEVIEQQVQPFPVVITDRHMPRMDGLALVHELNAARYPARLIVYSRVPTAAVAEEFRTVHRCGGGKN